MRKILMTCLLIGASTSVFAQGNETVQRSSSPSGLKINDSGQAVGSGGAAGARNSNAGPGASGSSSGELNSVASSQASSKGAVQIQGNTAIKANARNLNSVTTGRNSAAGNEVGTIGK